MGLDMYLSKKTYVRNWNHTKPEQLHEVTILKGGKPVDYIQPKRISYIEEQVACWRKANAIHAWFVANVQDGVDDCKDYYVDREQLRELLDAVNTLLDQIETIDGEVHAGTSYSGGEKTENYEPGKVISNPQICEDILPSQSGFFFGGTDYDEFYIKDLENTRDMLTDVLAEPEEYGSFYYNSSW